MDLDLIRFELSPTVRKLLKLEIGIKGAGSIRLTLEEDGIARSQLRSLQARVEKVFPGSGPVV